MFTSKLGSQSVRTPHLSDCWRPPPHTSYQSISSQPVCHARPSGHLSETNTPSNVRAKRQRPSASQTSPPSVAFNNYPSMLPRCDSYLNLSSSSLLMQTAHSNLFWTSTQTSNKNKCFRYLQHFCHAIQSDGKHKQCIDLNRSCSGLRDRNASFLWPSDTFRGTYLACRIKQRCFTKFSAGPIQSCCCAHLPKKHSNAVLIESDFQFAYQSPTLPFRH